MKFKAVMGSSKAESTLFYMLHALSQPVTPNFQSKWKMLDPADDRIDETEIVKKRMMRAFTATKLLTLRFRPFIFNDIKLK